MGTMRSHSHVQTEHAYCVPAASKGNVQSLQKEEVVHHGSTQVTFEPRGHND